MAVDGVRIDGCILPGHVSVIIGLKAYRPFFERHRMPCVVAGFEPGDILQAVAMLVEQFETGRPCLENAYPRAVAEEGNLKAQHILTQVFRVGDACWRGIGRIPDSGMQIRESYAAYDAGRRFALRLPEPKAPRGCAGRRDPDGPENPAGVCALQRRCARRSTRWAPAWCRARAHVPRITATIMSNE